MPGSTRSSTASTTGSGVQSKLWEQREHELVSKFSTLVDCLKNEISRQRECITTLRQPSHALKEVRSIVLVLRNGIASGATIHHVSRLSVSLPLLEIIIILIIIKGLGIASFDS